jgi:predicted HTH domain antitoxin
MASLTIEIGEEFARSFGGTAEEAARNVRIELAIEMYREGRWSTGFAAEFCGMQRGPFSEILVQRRVELPYSEACLEDDLRHGGCGV